MTQFAHTEKVTIDKIRAGDCVFIHGHWRTVGREDIKRGFTGITIRGDPLILEGRMIERAIIRN